uniref:Latrophilin Cirl n=1 Tax=Lygus hesperus TaxID=30085 RepID=A0A0A9YA75_LYGHE
MSSRGAALLIVMPIILLVSSIDATKIIMKRACKGDTLAMRCLQDQHVLVRTVYFGRSNETICHEVGSVTSVTCTNNKDKSLLKVQDKCDYKRNCFVNHSDLVDDCGNSYLEVEFICCKTARKFYVCNSFTQEGPLCP